MRDVYLNNEHTPYQIEREVSNIHEYIIRSNIYSEKDKNNFEEFFKGFKKDKIIYIRFDGRKKCHISFLNDHKLYIPYKILNCYISDPYWGINEMYIYIEAKKVKAR